MPMSFAGHAASLSGCAIGPRGDETGLTGSAGRTRISSLIGSYAMATAEHREPCESRGSCTVLGAPGGEIPPGDSTSAVTTAGSKRPLGASDDLPYTGHGSADSADVRCVPTADVSRCNKLRGQRLGLLDQLVGAGDQRWR